MTSTMVAGSKEADLAGPGIGDYAELEKVLPQDYHPILGPRETQEAIYIVKDEIEAGLCRELGLIRVQVPLIVDASRASTTCSTATGHGRRSSSTSRTTATSIRSTPRSSRPPPSGRGSRSRNSRWRPARASSRTCARSARTTSSTTTTASTSTSGTGRRSSPPAERDLDLPAAHGPRDLAGPARRRGAGPDRVPAAPHRPLSRTCPSTSPSSTRRRSWSAIRPCRASSARRASCRTSQRSSSSASAGRSRTAIRTRCARPTTTTGSPRRSRRRPPDARPQRRHPGLEPGHPPPP